MKMKIKLSSTFVDKRYINIPENLHMYQLDNDLSATEHLRNINSLPAI